MTLLNNSGKNWEEIIRTLKKCSHPLSTGYCAKYVANALMAGGFKFERQQYAGMYIPVLRHIGFKEIFPTQAKIKAMNYAEFKPGDIVVWIALPGHMQMYDGMQWISDFRQRRFYPGVKFEEVKYEVFRHPDALYYKLR